jgi:hypothetical protein
MSEFSPEALDAMLKCYFFGEKGASKLTIAAFCKNGREVGVKGYARIPVDGIFEVKKGVLSNTKDIVFAPARDDWGEITSVSMCDGDKRLISFSFNDGLDVTVGTRLRIPSGQAAVKIVSTSKSEKQS